LKTQPSEEDIKIMLIRARHAILTLEDNPQFDYACGVHRTLNWLFNHGTEPLTSETKWLPPP